MSVDDDIMVVNDACTHIVAQSVQQIARRAGLPIGRTRKALDTMVRRGNLDEYECRYRIGYHDSWITTEEDLPPLNVGHCITAASSRKGFKVAITGPEVHIKAEEMSQSDLFMSL